MTQANIGRRAALTLAGAAAGSGVITGFPTIWAQNIRNITLRQFGTGVSNLNALADKVKQDLGFTLAMTALDTDAVSQKAVTQPRSYDIADIEYFICKKVFPAGVLQPMDVKRIKNYDKIVPIFTTGRLSANSRIAQGTAPHTVGFVEGPNSVKFAAEPTGWMTLIPTIYNADTLGIRPDLVGRPIRNWRDLVDPAFKGRASILNIPSIGIMDAAMVMVASPRREPIQLPASSPRSARRPRSGWCSDQTRRENGSGHQLGSMGNIHRLHPPTMMPTPIAARPAAARGPAPPAAAARQRAVRAYGRRRPASAPSAARAVPGRAARPGRRRAS